MPAAINRREVPPIEAGAKLATINQTAVALGCSRDTVYREIQRGHLRDKHLGAAHMVYVESIVDLLTARE